jgi:hypothetical protein
MTLRTAPSSISCAARLKYPAWSTDQPSLSACDDRLNDRVRFCSWFYRGREGRASSPFEGAKGVSGVPICADSVHRGFVSQSLAFPFVDDVDISRVEWSRHLRSHRDGLSPASWFWKKSKAAVRKLAGGLTREIEPSSASSFSRRSSREDSLPPSTSFFHRVRSPVRISNPCGSHGPFGGAGGGCMLSHSRELLVDVDLH